MYIQLRDVLLAEINEGESGAQLDIIRYLNRCTLDIIGLAGTVIVVLVSQPWV